jgi:hypothetical protein
MVELLRMEHDPVVRATATCLRNLAIDPRNKELIGKTNVQLEIQETKEWWSRFRMSGTETYRAVTLKWLFF